MSLVRRGESRRTYKTGPDACSAAKTSASPVTDSDVERSSDDSRSALLSPFAGAWLQGKRGKGCAA